MTVINITDGTLKGSVTGPTFTGNVDGAKFTGSVTYVDTPQPAVPVISSTEFTIAGNPPLDTLIGKVVASNSPVSYAITEGNTAGYFAIYSSANLRTSETVKAPNAVYPLKVTATNAAGTSAPQTITVTIGTGDVIPPSTITHGQQIALTNVGRIGAKAASIANYNDTMTTITGAQTYSTSRVFNNVTFTGMVKVTGGNVVFNFCLFNAKPPSASSSSGAALQQYNAGAAAGTVVCNWCDFDSGLRGSEGNFETEAFNAGQRGAQLTNQSASTFTLYRCRIQGYGNGVSIDGWQCAVSDITECYIGDCTSGGGSHKDVIEIYGSDNVTVQRCRLVGVPNGQCVLANVTNDMYAVVKSNPIILQHNMVLPNGDNAPVLIARNDANQPYKRNVRVIGNYWGDKTNFGFEVQLAGNENPMTGLNVTHDLAYFNANQATSTPGLVYWASDNVWTPDGEGVTNQSGALGRPHTAGAFVSPANFSNGSAAWNGKVLPASGGGGGGGGGGIYDNLTEWPSAINRPMWAASTNTLTWTGPTAGGPSTANDTQQSLVLTNSTATGSTSNGQVVSGLNLTKGFVVTHSNVTIKRCRITAGGWTTVGVGSGGTTIEDCLVDAVGSSDQLTGISYGGGSNFGVSNATIRRCNVINAENDMGNGWTNCTVIDNWLHKAYGEGSRHADLLEVYSCSNTTIQHNSFDGADYFNELNAGLNVTEDNGRISGLQIVNNCFVNLPSWTICFGNPAHPGGSCSATNNGFFPRVNNRAWSGTISPNSGNFIMSSASSTTGTLIGPSGAM